MLKRTFLFSLLVLFCLQFSFGQLEENYHPIEFEGTIPADLMTSVKALTLSELSSDENTLSEEEGKEYYALSNYAFQEAMQNGKIYFNDEFSAYLGKIVDHLLKDDPQLRKAIRVYATRLPSPNATAWRNGVILFNLSLFSYLESEAEIAFVLAHEISHVKEQHTLLRFKKTVEIGASVYDNSESIEDLFELLRFSRDHELEADNLAFSLMKNSGYALDGARQALIHLKESNNREVVFKRDLTKLFQVPDSVIKFDVYCDSLDFLAKEDTLEYNDSLSTHPDIDKRISLIEKELVDKTDSLNRKLFVEPEDTFQKLQEMVYFEQMHNYYNRGSYISVLYGALSMAEYYPDNQYVHEMAAKSLFWISRYAMQRNRRILIPKLDRLTGTFGLFCCFFKKASLFKVNDLAQYYIKEQLKRFPESEELSIHLAKAYHIRKDYKEAKSSYKDYLESFQNGKHADYAKIKLEDLRARITE